MQFEEGLELGEPGVDLEHIVSEVAGLLSEGMNYLPSGFDMETLDLKIRQD